MADVTVVILSYNTAVLTQKAVLSALALTPSVDVLVVDNHSSDETVPILRKLAAKEPRLSLIARDVNDGFAAGNNVALRTIQTPYVILLNSDAYFPTDFALQDCVAHFADTTVGIVTPKVVLSNGHLDPACHRGFPTPWNAFCYFTGLERLTGKTPLARIFGGYHQTWKNLATVHDVDACTAACMVISTPAMQRVGLLDEQFFMYGEDLDWCYRFQKAGYRLVYDPRLQATHAKHASGLKKSQTVSPSKLAFYDAMVLFYDKHLRASYPSWVRTLLIFSIQMLAHSKGVPYVANRH